MPDGRPTSPEAPVAPPKPAEGSKEPGFSAAPTEASSPKRSRFDSAPAGKPDGKPAPEPKDGKKDGEPKDGPKKTEPKEPTDPPEEPKKPDYEAPEVEVQRDEKGRLIATTVNATENLEKRIRKEAQDQVREAATAESWLTVNPKTLWKKLKLKFGEEYYVQRGVSMLREAAKENNNVYLDMDIITNEASYLNRKYRQIRGKDAPAPVDRVRKADRGRDAHKSEAHAKLEQISLGQQIEDDTSVQNVKEDVQGPLKDLIVDEVFRKIINKDITDQKGVQQALREFVEKHENHPDESVRNQINEVFGRTATDFNERAQMFATNFLEVGQELAKDGVAHDAAIEQIAEKIRIDLANTEWASSTELQFSKADKLATKLKGTKYGNLLNETTVGALVSIGTFVGVRNIGRGLHAAGAAAGAGALTGAVIGAYERNRNLKKDIAAHRARTEYGQNVDTTPRTDGLRGKIADKLNTSKKLEEFRYKEIASVEDMLHNDRDRSALGGDPRSLDTLLSKLQEDSLSTENRNALARRVAEIQERLHYSAKEGKGMIQWEGETKSEQGRLDLVRGIAKGRLALEKALIDGGSNPEDAKAEVAEMLRNSRSDWQERFIDDVETQEKRFRTYRIYSSLTHGTFGGAVGFAGALGTQTAFAEIGAHILDNKPVNETILEGWNANPDKLAANVGIDLENHRGPNSEAINDLKDALENNQPNDVVASFGDMGIQVHTDQKGQIIIDSVNGTPVDATLPPTTITYDQEKGSFMFHGNIPPEARTILEQNDFTVGGPTNPSEAVQANPQPELQTIPGTNAQVEIPLGTELRQGPNGTFDLYTKDVKAPIDMAATSNMRGIQMPEGTLDGTSGIKVAEGLQFDSTGHMIAGKGEIIRPDIIQLGEPKPGPDAAMETNKWLEENSAHTQVEQWYGNNSEGSDNNELKFYDRRVGPEAVQFDMLSMEKSWQNGNFPPNVDVPDVIKQDRAVFTFWDKNNPDQPIIVKADHGQLTLDKNSSEMVKVWKTLPDGTQGWADVKNSEVSQAVLGNLGDFEEASDIGHKEILNYNVSAGDLQMRNGEPLVSSYATAQGTGSPPEKIGTPSEITTFQAVQTTEVQFPEGWEPMPIATPITPRRHLTESTEPAGSPDTNGNKERQNPYGYGGYGGNEDLGLIAWDKFPERRSTSLSNPEAKLDERTEVRRFIDSLDPAYRQELEEMNSLVGRPMDSKARAVITIPALGEGRNMQKTLSHFLNQKANNGEPLDPSLFEIVILDNHPSTVDKDITEDEVRQFQTDHPEIRIVYAHKEWRESDPKTVGNARRYASDLALLRSIQRPTHEGDLILINGDADVEGVSDKYVADYIREFDTKDRVDAIGGRWNLPDWTLENPNVKAAQRFWYSLDRLIQMDAVGDPANREKRAVSLIGRNSAVRASIYAGVGGFNPEAKLAEDLELGWMISDARDWRADRFSYLNRSELVSSPRRFLAAMVQGRPLLEMYAGFHENTDVRSMDDRALFEQIPNDFDRNRLENEMDTFWQAGKNGQYVHVGDKFPEYFQRAANLLGVEYTIVDDHIKLTNTERYEATFPSAQSPAPPTVREDQPVNETSSQPETQPSPDTETTLESETSTALPDQAELSPTARLRNEINEHIRNTTETNYIFGLTPDMLADFVKNNPQLFGDKIAIEDLEAKVVNNKLEMNGRFMYDSNRQVDLNNATFVFTREGHIALEGNPDFNLDNLPFALRGIARRLISSRMKLVDERVRDAINAQLENDAWGVESFRLVNGEINIALSNRPEVRRYSSAYGPEEIATAMPAPETGSSETVAPTPEPAPTTEPEVELERTGPLPRIETEDITTLDSAPNVTEFINKELEAETGDQHVFALEPGALSQYLLAETRNAAAAGQNDRLFGGNVTFSDMDIRVEGGQVVISARYNVRNRADMDVRQEVFEVNDEGRLVQVGRTSAKNNFGILRRRLDIPTLDLRSFGDSFAAFMNQRIDPDWNASGRYALVDGNLAMIVERRPETETETIPQVPPAEPVVPTATPRPENPPTAPLPITEINSSGEFNERILETLDTEQADEHLFTADPAILSDYIYEETRDPHNFFGNVLSFAPQLEDNITPNPDRRRLNIAVDGNTIVVNGDFTINGQYNMRLEGARFNINEYGQLEPADNAAITNLGVVNEGLEARTGSDDKSDTARMLAQGAIEQFGGNLMQLINRGLERDGNRTWQVDGFRIFGNNLGLVTHRRHQQAAA